MKGDLNTHFYYGYLLPIDDCNSTYDEEASLIVKILPEYCDFFNSKARVPVSLTFETIKLNEVKYWEDKYIKDINYEEIAKEKLKSYLIEYNSIEDFLDKNNNNIQELKQESNFIKYDEKSNVYGLVDWNKADPKFNIFGKPWIITEQEIQNESNFKNFSTYKIKRFIYKSNDDLKQELMILQIFKRCQEIFDNKSLKLKLTTYDILITSERSGMVEVLRDTKSIDQIKKFIPGVFEGLECLEDLDISVNCFNVETIDTAVFDGLKCLKYIFIRDFKDRNTSDANLDYLKRDGLSVDFFLVDAD